MTEALQGLFQYSGIQQWEDVDWTDISGISPSMIQVKVYPQQGYPAADGDCVFSYGNNQITVKRCHVDAARYVKNGGGQIVQVTILDERWRWAYGSISGRYNFKNVKAYDAAFSAGASVGFVDPAHEKTPSELATLLVKAMGYAASDWDLSKLPEEARPEVNWTEANPAQELNNLADSFGLRIVPVRSKGKWALVVTGEGADLPTSYPESPDSSSGIDPANMPDWIKVVTAPILYESRLQLQPVAKDIDGVWRVFRDLSYAISQGNSPLSDPFVNYDKTFMAIDGTRVFQADGSLVSQRELAIQTVMRNFVLNRKTSGASDDFQIPGLQDSVTSEQIILSDKLVRPWVDNNDNSVHDRPAFIEGTFWTAIKGTTGNWPLGTRLDRQAAVYGSPSQPDEVVSFTVNVNEDGRWSMITTSDMVVKTKKITPLGGGAQVDSYMSVPNLYLHCAVQVCDEDTWAVNRYSVAKWIGQGPQRGSADDDDAFVWSIVKDDIQPFYRGVYATDGTLQQTIDNTTQIKKECNYYIDSLLKTLQTLNNETRSYYGIYPIDLDGKIQQVTYRIGSSGADTIASSNTEHDYELPTYESRRQRDSRKSPENKEAVQREILANLRQAGLAPGK